MTHGDVKIELNDGSYGEGKQSMLRLKAIVDMMF